MDPFWFIASVMGRPLVEETTIYETALPLYLDMFREHGVKATFFIVGKDLEDKRNLPGVERILAAGHEVANHSYMHRTDLKRLPQQDMIFEIDRFVELLESNFGIRPKGFKSPAYGINPFILKHLQNQGYIYDSSVHPSIAVPLVKGVQRFWLRYKKGASEFGQWRAALAPQKPYFPDEEAIYRSGGMHLLEIPVSTMPVFRLPFHFSFVNIGGLGLYRLARAMGAMLGDRFLNYAFHAVDILDTSQIPGQLRKRPGVGKPTSAKLRDMAFILRDLRRHFRMGTTAETASLWTDEHCT